MTPHNKAKIGEIAQRVLLPGDPLRAKYIAENFLENAKEVNNVRNMLTFTGKYKGVDVSVQGTGMGMPSMGIYAYELLNFYGATKLIRVGTCGSLSKDVKLRDVVLAIAASTDSGMNKERFPNMNYSAVADFNLLKLAYENSKDKNKIHVKSVFTSDKFYDDNFNAKMQNLIDYGIVAVDMESCELYTLAQKYKAQALSIMTVSDNLITHEECTSEERQESFNDMLNLALETIIK